MSVFLHLNWWTEHSRWRAPSGWTSPNTLTVPTEQKLGRRLNSFPLSAELKHISSPAVGWDLQHWLPCSQAFGLELEFTPLTSLHPPACRRQIAGLLSLHNHVSQFLGINLIFYIYPSIPLLLFLPRTLTNTS